MTSSPSGLLNLFRSGRVCRWLLYFDVGRLGEHLLFEVVTALLVVGVGKGLAEPTRQRTSDLWAEHVAAKTARCEPIC